VFAARPFKPWRFALVCAAAGVSRYAPAPASRLKRYPTRDARCLDALAVVGWHRLNHRLTPGVRAHYPIKGCQLLRKVQQLIRRKKIFKVPVGGLLDGLSPAPFCWRE
jgi:hypothetical protein